MNIAVTAQIARNGKSKSVHELFVDETDRKIIQATQCGLPLVSRPYDVIAESIGASGNEVRQRLLDMQKKGIIRRIAAVPNHYMLGYKGNGMTVWNVPDELIAELGPRVGALNFVSHCYHRPRCLPDWPYNLFAMVHAHNREDALLLVDEIANLLGDADCGHDILFSSRILKKTGMRLLT